MANFGIAGLVLLLINVYVSYRGLRDLSFFDRHAFEVDAILSRKDYKRLVTSGFLHSGWIHLAFNMIAFHSFSPGLEFKFGLLAFLVLYFGSLLGGNLLALFFHRNHPDYSAVGASGAVTGLVFASVAMFPGIDLYILFLPYPIPGWLYALLYVLYTIYGIRSQRDNICHEAHLGGGLIGLAIALALDPGKIATNPWPILLITVPSIIFLYVVVSRPWTLMVSNAFSSQRPATIEDRYHTSKRTEEKELNALLEKIGRGGMGSLTKAEKERLEELSK